ncbi:hypothetical protein HMPREF9098_1511 [Kingella denitrificans ATCC 33394]|uniref:Uncharacterized protein n=1 Tax=Kingella denitrificans ATCC 33394 TaxID=888741 RepID=F0F077_9NEIS|nr:hypothetical protein HMPREF9098_1511 [Kingella denitrificans ATCC 33394]
MRCIYSGKIASKEISTASPNMKKTAPPVPQSVQAAVKCAVFFQI